MPPVCYTVWMNGKISLIIPDLHHRWGQAEKIISNVGADEVIFLGDYFDDFNDTPEMVRETCEWLEASVKKPNRIHLFGNHDVHYAFTYRTFQCSGYEQWKYFIIHDTLPREVWDKLVWYHLLDDQWLLTHAGLHKHNLPDSIKKLRTDRPKFIAAIKDHLDHSIKEGFKAAANNVGHWCFNAGLARWGMQKVGGITWCDFEREFFPIKGLNQILGHTPQMQEPRWCVLDKDPLNSDGQVGYRPSDLYTPTLKQLSDSELSHNIDLDVHGNTHYGIWDGKKFTIGNYRDL